MIEISVKHNIDEISRRLRAAQKEIEAATQRAVNVTARGANTQMIDAISSEFNLTKSYVRERLRLRKATRKGRHAFEAVLIGNPYGRSKRAMNLIHFAQSKLTRAERSSWMRQQSGSTLRNPQLQFKIKRVGGRVYVKGAFVGNDGRTVFKRRGDARLPIDPVQTVGVPQMFSTTKAQRKVQDWIKENFPRIFERELKYRMTTAAAQ